MKHGRRYNCFITPVLLQNYADIRVATLPFLYQFHLILIYILSLKSEVLKRSKVTFCDDSHISLHLDRPVVWFSDRNTSHCDINVKVWVDIMANLYL